jgi:DNA-binding NarL/FixJ family response regulator
MARSRILSVLVVGADPLAREQVARELSARRMTIVESETRSAAEKLVRLIRFDAVICVDDLPDGSGLLLLDEVHSASPGTALLVAATSEAPELHLRPHVYGAIEVPAHGGAVQTIVDLAIDDALLTAAVRSLPRVRVVPNPPAES